MGESLFVVPLREQGFLQRHGILLQLVLELTGFGPVPGHLTLAPFISVVSKDVMMSFLPMLTCHAFFQPFNVDDEGLFKESLLLLAGWCIYHCSAGWWRV